MISAAISLHIENRASSEALCSGEALFVTVK